MKSKVDQLDIEKSVPVPVDLIKLNDAVKTWYCWKNMSFMLRSKTLKIKYLILLT